MTLNVVEKAKTRSTTHCPPTSAIMLINPAPVIKIECLYVLKNSYDKLATIKPKNVIGPTSAVDTAIKIDDKTSIRFTILSYSTPRLTATSLPSDKTSNWLMKRQPITMTTAIIASAHQMRSALMLLKLANILSCTRKNSFGSINTCKNVVTLWKNVPTIIPTSSKK